jgi:hypothetical protein
MRYAHFLRCCDRLVAARAKAAAAGAGARNRARRRPKLRLPKANQRAAVAEAEASHLWSRVSDLTVERDSWRDPSLALAAPAPGWGEERRCLARVTAATEEPLPPLVQETRPLLGACGTSAAAMSLRRYCERTTR